VTMVEKRGGLLGGVDRELAESLREQMSDAGMEIILQDEVAEVRNHPALRVPLGQRGGAPPAPDAPLEVALKSGRVLHPAAILVSSGRNGQTAGLELDRICIAVNERGDSKGFLKLLFHEDDLALLGVHVIGEQATELVHIGLTALLMKAKAELFIHTCYNYPTLSELYKYAAYDALGKWQKLRDERDAE